MDKKGAGALSIAFCFSSGIIMSGTLLLFDHIYAAIAIMVMTIFAVGTIASEISDKK